MKVVIGSDHGGYELKKIIIDYLKAREIEVVNLGTDSSESVDYPDYAEKLAKEYLNGGYDFGIGICGTGIGISIALNKFNGIRAALLSDAFSAKATKRHNNANFICFGGRTIGPEVAKDIIDAYMGASFEGDRHQRRLDKIEKIEEENRR
ncbi:ribose 5-phosphate isomerase B [Citroniella saccharovorans]|uniref:Ribose 5-phosphate isomerase B n=1 Tax=Citroniella saccharovorans TaxID=2053367 RepID=A0AAW9MU64_9FIRM|nr:ribose 5-phosphate isomerase B [Citroniella saccharovorans]MEB3429393.1 ribose 5-phosphate isomerase B [Citroniella saccharovorans]